MLISRGVRRMICIWSMSVFGARTALEAERGRSSIQPTFSKTPNVYMAAFLRFVVSFMCAGGSLLSIHSVEMVAATEQQTCTKIESHAAELREEARLWSCSPRCSSVGAWLLTQPNAMSQMAAHCMRWTRRAKTTLCAQPVSIIRDCRSSTNVPGSVFAREW